MSMTQIKTGSELVPEAQVKGDTVIAAVHGDIDLHNSPDLRGAMLEILQRANPKTLVLNLAQAPYMDSSAIAVLVETLQKLRRSQGKMCLTNLQPRVKSLLEIARLDSIFVLAKDDEEALSK